MITTFCTCGSLENAELIAKHLVNEKIAACVNIVPGIRSIYQWAGKIEDDQEVLLIIKSKKSAYAALEQCILNQHSYDLPEIISFDVQLGLDRYISWVEGREPSDSKYV